MVRFILRKKILLFLDVEKSSIQKNSLPLADEQETTLETALNVTGNGIERTALEICTLISGSNNFIIVKQIQCRSYDTVQQEGVIYVQASFSTSQVHVMTAKATPGLRPGENKKSHSFEVRSNPWKRDQMYSFPLLTCLIMNLFSSVAQLKSFFSLTQTLSAYLFLSNRKDTSLDWMAVCCQTLNIFYSGCSGLTSI